ncbi:MAG: DUF423 domain-containing protein [Verrucomicrobiales bacterium]
MSLSRLAATLASLGIILGALGAHGAVHDRLVSRQSLGTWETAVLYHLIHAVALWTMAGHSGPRAPAAAWLWVAGILLFSGSLYVLSVTRAPALGPITPLGGVAFIAGWLWLAVRPMATTS